jgi:hypothetical protein
MDPTAAARSRPSRTPASGQGAGRRARPGPGLLRAAGWGLLALVLALTFRAYLDPSLALDFDSFMQLCGLR